MIKNKRGQFFVIFAVLLGVIILVGATQINKISSKSDFNGFRLRCENYKNEIFEISKYAVIHDKSQEFTLLDQFSKNFFSYTNQSYKTEMFYLYGNSTSFIFTNASDGNQESYLDTTDITIPYGKISRTYNFNKDNRFYFLIKIEKGGDIYVCE